MRYIWMIFSKLRYLFNYLVRAGLPHAFPDESPPMVGFYHVKLKMAAEVVKWPVLVFKIPF